MLGGSGVTWWASSYDIRPARLFVGVEQRLMIYLSSGKQPAAFSSRYHRWHENLRPALLQQLAFTPAKNTVANSISKIGLRIEASILQKLQDRPPLERNLTEGGAGVLYYHNAPRYWIRATDFQPYFWNERDGPKLSTQVKTITVRKSDRSVVAAALNSSLFYWWFLVWSDCRHLNRREIDAFRFDPRALASETRRSLQKSLTQLMASFKAHKERKETTYATTGKVVYDEFRQKASKPIVDKIDRALAPHYGLAEEELDFIINYDIKYRMGKDL